MAKAGAGSVIDYEGENARLRAENLELRRVNELLKEASAFSRPNSTLRLEMIAFIDKYRDRYWGACSSAKRWLTTVRVGL